MIPEKVQKAIDCVDQALLDKYPLSGAMWPQWRVLISRIAAQDAEIERNAEDAKRLDWIECNATFIMLDGRKYHTMQIGTSRDAIDAAMRSANGGEVK